VERELEPRDLSATREPLDQLQLLHPLQEQNQLKLPHKKLPLPREVQRNQPRDTRKLLKDQQLPREPEREEEREPPENE
jgi:hypothetical protein